MKIFHEPILDSTSTRAGELARAGEPLPFAVIADEQTSGRGRRAKNWLSDKGNLYITLALPSPCATLECFPLWAANQLLLWLEETLPFTQGILGVKWPNDVLFRGRKLSGILCEASIVGSNVNYILLGIGLNVNCLPDHKNTFNPHCLKEIFQKEFDTKSLGESLFRFFVEKIKSYKISLDFFHSRDVGYGTLWTDNTNGNIYIGKGLNSMGSYVLESLDSKNLIVIESSDHNFSLNC